MQKTIQLSILALLVAFTLGGSAAIVHGETSGRTETGADTRIGTPSEPIMINTRGNANVKITPITMPARMQGTGTMPVRSGTEAEMKRDAAMKADMEARAEAKGEMRDERENRARMNSEERMKNFRQNFSTRFSNALERLMAVHTRFEGIADRIDSRLKKLSEEKVDVSVAAKFTASAREELRLSTDSMSSAKAAFTAEVDSEATASMTAENARGAFTKTFVYLKEAKDHLKNAHRNLVQAVQNIKSKNPAAAGTVNSSVDASASIHL